MKTNNQPTAAHDPQAGKQSILSKTSRTVKTRTFLFCVVAWPAISAVFLLWHELDAQFVTDMCLYFIVGVAIAMLSLSTTTLRIDGDSFTTTEPIACWIKTMAKLSDISHVEVKDTIWGKRLTIYYGDRLSTTIYPDNTDEITDFMESRNIEVRQRDV